MSGMARKARREGGFVRLLTMFASQRHKNINMQAEMIMKWRGGEKADATKALLAHTVAQPMVLWGMRGLYAATMGLAISSLWDLLGGEKPENEEEELHWAAALWDNLLATNFGNIPLGDFPGWAVREAFGTAAGYDPDVYSPDLSPVLSLSERTFKNVGKFASTATRYLDPDEDVAFGDVLSASWYGGVDLLTMTGAPTHLLRELAKPAKNRTTHTSLVGKRRRELMDKKKKEGPRGLTREEHSELATINRLYLGESGIAKLRRLGKDAEKKGNDARKAGDKKRADMLFKRAENYFNRADKRAKQAFGGGK